MDRNEILKKYAPTRENLLYILHDIQDSNPGNNLTTDDLAAVAHYVSTSKAEVMGVATFYSMYSIKERGKYIFRVCMSPPCHMLGSQSIMDYLKKTLKISDGETTEDKLFTLEVTSCLGVCAVAPAMMVNDEMYGNLTEQKIDEIIKKYREKA